MKNVEVKNGLTMAQRVWGQANRIILIQSSTQIRAEMWHDAILTLMSR